MGGYFYDERSGEMKIRIEKDMTPMNEIKPDENSKIVDNTKARIRSLEKQIDIMTGWMRCANGKDWRGRTIQDDTDASI